MAFIGIDRGIVDHWIYQDAEYFKVWFEMLYRARYSLEPEKKLIDNILVEMHYSEFVYGRNKWSDRLEVSERRLRTLVDKLLADGMIEVVNKYPRFTVYRIKNYAKYNQQNDQQETHAGQGTSDDDDQQNDQPATSRRPADDQRATTKEEGSNKENKGKKVNKEDQKIKYAEYVRLSPTEYEKLISEYGEEMTKECIDILNTYKGSTGKKYKSDYMTMTPTAWVPKRYHEDQEKKLKLITGGQYKGKQTTMSKIHELYNKALEEEQREANRGY